LILFTHLHRRQVFGGTGFDRLGQVKKSSVTAGGPGSGPTKPLKPSNAIEGHGAVFYFAPGQVAGRGMDFID
jgi:hypothetical protein